MSGHGLLPDATVTGRSGGSYGGLGSTHSTETTNAVHGNMRAPVDFGAGGSSASNTAWKTRGGGALKITSTTLTLDGQILSNGSALTSSYWTRYHSGGGSGGSIWLDVGTLKGAGSISANGGNGSHYYQYEGGGGGGGRVAVYYTDLTGFNSANIHTVGGTSSSPLPAASAGTVYLYDKTTNPVFVLKSLPSGTVSQSVGSVEVQWSAGLDPYSFDVTDVEVLDPYGAAVIASSVVQLSETRYVISFNPALSIDGKYQLAVGPYVITPFGHGMDQNFNGVTGEVLADVYRSSFTIDQTAPIAPTITSHASLPVSNLVNTSLVVIEGVREPGTSIWIDGVEKSILGTGLWSGLVVLPQGQSNVTVIGKDAAGNSSSPVVISFIVDSVAPSITGVLPLNGKLTSSVPQQIQLQHNERGSGIDIAGSQLEVIRNGVPISGNWVNTGTELLFTPLTAFSEGIYTIKARLKDVAGLQSSAFNAGFTIDRTPPPPLTLDPVPQITNINQHTFSGTKDPNSSVWVVPKTPATPVDLYTGLVAHWKGDGDATDSSGNNHHGTLMNGVKFASGVDGQAFSLDGLDDYIDIGNVPQFNFQDFTLSAWVLIDPVKNIGELRVISRDDVSTPGPDGRELYDLKTSSPAACGGVSGRASFGLGIKQFPTICAPSSLTYGWHHLAGVRLGNSIHLYVDGVLVSSSNVSIAGIISPESQLIIGQVSPSYNGEFFNSVLDDARIYNRALSQSEVSELVRLGGGVEAVALDGASTWSWTTPLDPGLNAFDFVAVDGAGNVSASVGTAITYDNAAPNAIGLLLNTDPYGSGSEVSLDWNLYDEVTQGGGDVAQYKIYWSTTPISLVSALTPNAVVASGTKSFRVTGLTRNTLYYFAVVPVDISLNYVDLVLAMNATPIDMIAAAEVSTVSMNATDVYADIHWLGSASSDAVYTQVYFNGGAAIQLPTATTMFHATGLLPSTSYPFRITTVDGSGNESAGVNGSVITLLANPVGVAAVASDGRVSLSWNAVVPSNLVKQYKVYSSSVAFTIIPQEIQTIKYKALFLFCYDYAKKWSRHE